MRNGGGNGSMVNAVVVLSFFCIVSCSVTNEFGEGGRERGVLLGF